MKQIRAINFFTVYASVAIFLVIASLIVVMIARSVYKSDSDSSVNTDFLVAFDQEILDVTATNYTSLIFDSNWRLYGSTVRGEIFSWDMAEDGTLINERVIYESPGYIIIGMAFDPDATPENPILWFTENSVMPPESPPLFSGKISQLVVSDYGTSDEAWDAHRMIDGLPRSAIDHLVNSISFGPDGAMYILMGSNSAMGARDDTWGMRPETLLSGSILRLDTEALLARDELPLNVATGIPEEDGFTLLDDNNYGLGAPELADLYDPQAPDAPLTLYATGLRNHYDMVWHSNGHFYVTVNGSSSGGNVPGTPDESPATCEHRIDIGLFGTYIETEVIAQDNIVAQPDFLADVVEGGYYGHPNPTRCEFVAHGGNPTDEVDPGQTGDHYPVGTYPDRNWRGWAFDFGPHQSANGIIEYQNADVFDGQLQGMMLTTRYARGNDVLILELGGEDNDDVIGFHESIPGLAYMNSPLDLIEDTRNGNIYVAEYGDRAILLLRPVETVTPELLANWGQRSTTVQFNDNLLRAWGLVFGAGVISLGTAVFVVVLYLRDEKRRWVGYLIRLVFAGGVALGLLYMAYEPARNGWHEFDRPIYHCAVRSGRSRRNTFNTDCFC